MKKNTDILKLAKAPLQEVIFEVRWELDIASDLNQPFDSNFDTAVGLMLSNVRKEFPLVKTKFPTGIQLPQDLLNYQTMYQYWSGDNTWPVLQLGPGIFTLNETEKKYEWDKHYFPLVKKSLNWLNKSYNRELKFNFACLRYIDIIRIKDYPFKDWLSFIKENLNFEFKNEFDTRGNLKQFNFNQVFGQDDGSELQFTISNGKNHLQEDILIWETSIFKLELFNNSNLIKWLNASHKTTSNLFKEICKNELYESFS